MNFDTTILALAIEETPAYYPWDAYVHPSGRTLRERRGITFSIEFTRPVLLDNVVAKGCVEPTAGSLPRCRRRVIIDDDSDSSDEED